jgi:DNA-directed RNA polymerase subunit RPC12/RpoP
MAIRFTCQSCQQPIEVDDQWAGQAVACPYCKKVITAPKESTWPTSEVPEAKPTDSTFRPPPPPPGQASPSFATARETKTAQWALVLAIISAVLCLLAWILFITVVGGEAIEIAGKDADPEQLNEALRKILLQGQFTVPGATKAMATIGVLCGLGGIFLSIHALVQSSPHKVMAIFALVIGITFQLCQVPLSMYVFFPPPAGG